jgi:ribosomal protein S18 acetylase RimI-like enzyme
MTTEDIPQVYAISLRIHSLYEDQEIFQERRSLSRGSFVLLYNEKVVGYLISHPYRQDTYPPLNTLIHEIPKDPDTWYIHDLAILPEFRGRGMVRYILAEVKALALIYGIEELSLVSIYGKEKFWKRMGFRLGTGANYGTLMKQVFV